MIYPFLVGFTVYTYLFYKYRNPPYGKQDKNTKHPFYFNPFSLPLFAGSLGLGIFVNAPFVRQIHLVFNGTTLKERNSILKELNGGKMHKPNFMEGMMNIYDFLRKPIEKSLV